MANVERITGSPRVRNAVRTAGWDEYDRDGLRAIRIPPPVLALRERFRQEVESWLNHFDSPAPGESTDLAQRFPQVAQRDRPLIGRLYKVARRFPSVKQIACHDSLLELAREAMQTEMVSCCNFVSVRIDLPGEQKYLVQPHQDFPYIQGSLNGVTIWLPLEDCPLEMGPPSWVAGSHLQSVLPVHEFTLEQAGQVGANIFELAEPEKLAELSFQRTPVGPTEALLFHTLLLHRSEPNLSDRARVSLQLRFDDLLDENSFRRDYPEGRYLDNRLSASYPEFCPNKEIP